MSPVTAGHRWSPLVTVGHFWSPRLPLVTSGHRWSPLVTFYCLLSPLTNSCLSAVISFHFLSPLVL